MEDSQEIEFHPVQNHKFGREAARLRTEVTLRAYEVYKHVFHPQEAMVQGGCRGGFSAGEIIAFLYAHSFPQPEWGSRVDEAMKGMKGL